MHSMEYFTKTQALKTIEKMVGFPKPAVDSLGLYFDYFDGNYIPRVNFVSLAEAIKQRELVKKLGAVIHLKKTNRERQVVMVEIYGVIKKHALKPEDYVV